MEVASRLAGRVDVHCHSRMILSIWFSDNMKYIGIAQLEGLRTTISRRLRWKNADRRKSSWKWVWTSRSTTITATNSFLI